MKSKLNFIAVLLIFVMCFSAFGVSASETFISGSFTYIVEDGEATIISCDTAEEGVVSIPSTLGGYPVTAIDMYAFEDCADITSVNIPDSVTSIGQNSFCGCTSLQSVTIGNGVTKIPSWAFYGCVALRNVSIGSSVSSVDAAAFEKCASLSSITVSGNNFAAENGVLFNKAKTEIVIYPQGKADVSYTVPETVTTISDTSFVNAKNLTEIVIPASVTSISESAFSSCDNLKGIVINASNATYSSENGVLFNKAKTQLICYPKKKEATEYILPNGVINILPYAFNDCDVLTSVVISETVTNIGEYAFYSCSNLNEVKIPYSVESIGNSAFSLCSSIDDVTVPDGISEIEKYVFLGCTNLKKITLFSSLTDVDESAFAYCGDIADVYYTGSEATWANIDIASGNDDLTGAIKHYNLTIVKEILVAASENTIAATVRAENIPQDAVVYLATYNSSGTLLQTAKLTYNNLVAEFARESVAEMRLFVWKSDMQPILDLTGKEI